MTKNRIILNEGREAIPSPPEVTPFNERYGLAIDEFWNDTAYGDFFARIPRTETGIAVVGNSTGLLNRRGLITSVQVTAGGTTGIFQRRITGALASAQFSVAYDSDGFPTITFAAGDAVTACAIEQLSPPTTIDTFLQVDEPLP
jgi:hypothetical protein